MIVVAIILSLIGATYLSAMSMSLRALSRAALYRRLEPTGRIGAGQRMIDRLHETILVNDLLRICFRIGVFVSVLLEFIGIGQNATLEAIGLLKSFAVAVFGLWIFTTVMASAIAKYAGVGLVARSLWLLRTFGALGIPVSRLVGFVDEAVRRLAGAELNNRQEPDEQLLRSIEEQQYEGALDKEAAELLENVVEFRSTDAAQVMTPRTDIEGIELTDDLARIREFIMEARHSRIPVYKENLDNILGILYIRDLVPFLGRDTAKIDLVPLLRKPIVVPMTKPVHELLGDFQRNEVHLAIVIDEYGGTAGLVTIEDVLEEIVGEIHDEHEPEDDELPELRTIDGARAEVDGRFHIDDLNERLNLDLPEDADFDTVAGFVLSQLGRVPQVGDSFEACNARFTALAATPTHVKRIGIELLEPAGVEGNGNAEEGK